MNVLDIGINVIRAARVATQLAGYFYYEPSERPGTKVENITQRVDSAARGAIILVEVAKCFAGPEVQSVLCKTESGVRLIKAMAHFSAGRETDSIKAQEALYAEAGAEFLGALRSFAEGGALDQEALLKMSDADIGKNRIDITKYDPILETFVVIGTRAMTRQDCQNALDEELMVSGVATIGELASRIFSIFRRRQDTDQQAAFAAAGAPPQAGAAAIAPHDGPAYLGPEGMFDFLEWRQIPTELHGDPVLSAVTCPITLMPIRYAAIARGNPLHIFEKSALVRHLQAQTSRGAPTTHPLTIAPMTLADIINDVGTQGIINARLLRLSNTLKARYVAPIQQDLAAIPA